MFAPHAGSPYYNAYYIEYWQLYSSSISHPLQLTDLGCSIEHYHA